MSFVRKYLPDGVNAKMMYYTGVVSCYIQWYINNTFSASGITDQLYVGDLASASNNNAMKEQGITHIVSVFNGSFEIFPDEFRYKVIHINDDPWVNIGKYFDETNEFIDQALQNPTNKVMIHCQTKQIPIEQVTDTINQVLKEVKERRPIAEPNEGFLECLRRYINRLNNYPNTQKDEMTLLTDSGKYQDDESENESTDTPSSLHQSDVQPQNDSSTD
jgi:hypothetical protein